MENFKNIAEECINKKIFGTFILRDSTEFRSSELGYSKDKSNNWPYKWGFDDSFTMDGKQYEEGIGQRDIICFINDNNKSKKIIFNE